jgi:drug/metabolite transporter (DMT)-like permease
MTTQIQQISESRKKLASAYRAVYAIGVLYIFLSIILFVAGNRLPDYVILGIVFLFFGLLYLVLGYFVQRKSKIALGIAVGLMSLNALTGIYNMIQTGNPFGLSVPMIFLGQTIEGFKAIEVLKSKT